MCKTANISTQCAAQSVGAANQLFMSLIQTFLTAQCNIPSPDFWPRDYGEVALKQGLNFSESFLMRKINK